MQLNYLQSLDAGVESIVTTAGHVALYDFNPGTSQWSRKDVEGSLFLVSKRDGTCIMFVRTVSLRVHCVHSGISSRVITYHRSRIPSYMMTPHRFQVDSSS